MMVEPVRGRELGLRLCEIFGLDPDHVAGISIEADADGVAAVVVRRLVSVPESDVLGETLEQYVLVRRGLDAR